AGDFRVAVAKTTVTLSLKVADPADSTRKHRTGDTIQVELQVAASDIARNATSLDATITVPSADYVLVNAPTPSKVVATAPVVKTTNGVAFGNAFTSKGGSSADGTNNNLSGNTITLKIDGTALNLLSTTPVTIGTFYVRPKYNGDTSGAPKNLTIGASPMIGIRASDTNAGYTVGDLGFTFEAGVNGGGSTARVAVDPTTVAMSLVPTLPSPLRIGGEIKVDVKITPTYASYINHVQTAIAINGSQFQIVEHGLLANSQTVTASAFGTNPVKSNTFASNVLTYEVASGDLSTLTAGTSPITIGTFYVRPRMKVVTNLDFTSTTVANEKQPDDSYLFNVTTTQKAAIPAVTAALGTLGVSLAMRSPTVQYNTLSGTEIPFIASTTSQRTLNVVDGRYLDVRINVLAEADTGGKAKEVDRFLIDLTIDPLQ
ncbi:MAG: hypothetical protein EBT00_17140, partial [Proteobacteria bacterium]|nr:hypothetical protein [Pseudomonadota bacterium]